jgi:hypothetical protein
MSLFLVCGVIISALLRFFFLTKDPNQEDTMSDISPYV